MSVVNAHGFIVPGLGEMQAIANSARRRGRAVRVAVFGAGAVGRVLWRTTH